MRYLIKCIVFCGITSILWGQNTFITLNNEEISFNDFTRTQAYNLEQVGVKESIDLFVEFELLKQYALDNNAEQNTQFLVNYNNGLKFFKENNFLPPERLHHELSSLLSKIQTEYKIQVLVVEPKDMSVVKKKIKTEDFTSLIEKYSINKSFLNPTYIQPTIFDEDTFASLMGLKVGSITQAFPYQDNFLFVKKVNQRPSLGMLKLQRISNKEEAKIQEAYNALKNGTNFSEAVTMYSDKGKENKGFLPELYTGIPDEAYNQIKNLKKDEFTVPFKNGDSYEIIKLIYAKPFDNVQNNKELLIKLFKNTTVYNTITAQNYSKVESVEEFKQYPENIKEFTENGAKYWRDSLNYAQYSKPLYQLHDSIINVSDILNIIHQSKISPITNDMATYFLRQEMYLTQKDYYENVLFFREDYIRPKVDSLRKVQLITYAFDYISKKAGKDDQGLENFLQKNKEKYTFDERADMIIYYCNDQETANAIKKQLKKKKSRNEILENYKGKLDEKNAPIVRTEEGKVTQDSPSYPKNVAFKKGVYITQDNNKYLVTKVKTIRPKERMTLAEAKQNLFDVYQNEFYKKTIENLKNTAVVEVNPTLKAQLLTQYKP